MFTSKLSFTGLFVQMLLEMMVLFSTAIFHVVMQVI